VRLLGRTAVAIKKQIPENSNKVAFLKNLASIAGIGIRIIFLTSFQAPNYEQHARDHFSGKTDSAMRIKFDRLKLLSGVILGLLVFCGERAEAQTFRISKLRVCSSYVNNLCTEVPPPYDALDRRKFPAGRVHVAFVLQCGKPALDFLTEHEFLPVNVAVWVNGIRSSDIPAGITQDKCADQGAQLIEAHEELGQFPWRTRFNMRFRAEISTISFEIQDGQQQFVITESEQPARLTLKFTN
jgi:hypothetical protein